MRIQTWTRGLAACILGFAKAGNGQTVFQPRSTDGKITFNMDTWQFPGLFKDKAMLIWFKDASTQIVVAYLKNENQTAIAVAKAADDDQANYVDSGSEVRRAIIPTFASGPFTLDRELNLLYLVNNRNCLLPLLHDACLGLLLTEGLSRSRSGWEQYDGLNHAHHGSRRGGTRSKRCG